MGYWSEHPLAGDTPLDMVGRMQKLLLTSIELEYEYEKMEETFALRLRDEEMIRKVASMDYSLAGDKCYFVLPFLLAQHEIKIKDEMLSKQVKSMIGDGGAASRDYTLTEAEGPHIHAKVLYELWDGLMSGQTPFNCIEDDKGLFATMAEKLAETGKTVSAENFLGTVSVNVDNVKLSDKEFREFVRKTLPIVEFERKRNTEYLHHPQHVRLRRSTVSVTALIKNKFLPSGAILQLHDNFGNVLKYKAIAKIEYSNNRIASLDFNTVLHPTALAINCFRDAQCLPMGQVVGAHHWYWHHGNASESLYDMWTRYLRSTEHD